MIKIGLVMDIKVIQRMFPLSTQVTVKLQTGNEISGKLIEIGLNHIALDRGNGRMEVLVPNSIFTMNNQVEVQEPSVPTPVLTPVSESSEIAPIQVEESETSDTIHTLSETVTPSDTDPISTEEPELSDTTPIPSEATAASQLTHDQTDLAATPSDTDPISTEEPELSDTTPIPSEAAAVSQPTHDQTDLAATPSDTDPISTEEPELSDTTSIPSEAAAASQLTHDQTDLAATPSDTDPISTEEPELSDTTSIPSEAAAVSQPTHDQIDSVEFDERASEKLHEIESGFNIEIQSAKIDLEPLNITFSAIAEKLPGWQNTGVRNEWKPIEDQYKHAVKIGELDTKFGRIQQITEKAKNLVERFPRYPALKHVLAYFYSISNKWDEALQNYAEAAAQSGEARDWFNVAVSASKLNKEEIVCFSLEEFFCEVPIVDKPQAWFVYVNLLEKFNNLPTFHELCKMDDIKDDEMEFLLNTAIYLLKKTGAETFAIKIIEKWLSRGSLKLLLEEACQELDGQPTESYYEFVESYDQFVMEFSIADENLYEEAEKADQSGNLVSAERLYKECLRRNIRRDTVIMDLAMVYVQLDRAEEAAQLLEENRSKVKYTQQHRLDNLLTTTVYPKAGHYEKVIDFLNNALKLERNEEKRWQFFWQIANAYIRLRDYPSAESQCLQALELRPDNITVQRSLAICVSQQGHYDRAIDILNQIQDISPSAKTAELLAKIENAKVTEKFILDDDNFIPALSDFGGELSDFARFFLDRCTFEGMRSERKEKYIRGKKYMGEESDAKVDIAEITDVAKSLGPSNPSARNPYNLAVAKIYLDVGYNLGLFYENLCRTFVSRGDAAVIDDGDLDAAREWYCEALTAYDGYIRHRQNEAFDDLRKDVSASLVRYLYATLGSDHIPRPPNIPQLGEAIEAVILSHPDHSEHEEVFQAIAYLISHSGYAANMILKHLYDNPKLYNRVLDYLREIEITLPSTIKDLKDFKKPWSLLRDKLFNEFGNTLRALEVLETFELSAAWLKDNQGHVENIQTNLFFRLDKQRIRKLGEIFKIASEIFDQEDFVEKERRCKLIDSYCTELLKRIEANPTKISVAGVYPIVVVIQKEATVYLEWLYENRKPDVRLRLAEGKDKSYIDKNEKRDVLDDRKIRVQIVVENGKGRMSADELKLVVEVDQEFCDGYNILGSLPVLEAGETARKILEVDLFLADRGLESKVFSLKAYAEYGLRGGKRERTQIENFRIQLVDFDAEFKEIENPYLIYAGGGPVKDSEMFFGRDELIDDIISVIQKSHFHSQCILVYGQYRSGKSSVLLHLNDKLQQIQQKDKDLFVLNLGNMKKYLQTNIKVDIQHQFLGGILMELKKVVEESVKIPIPDTKEFYSHPSPRQFFEEIFGTLKRDLKQEGKEDIHIVLLMDEFQYVYELIVTDKLEWSFMKDWKALLQENNFSAVLIGTDGMSKFISKFPNEFGTTDDSKRVTYLDTKYATDLIVKPILDEKGRSRYKEQSIQRILDLTAGSPWYIQIICDRLVRYMNEEAVPFVTEADVEQVKKYLIQGGKALNENKFHSLTKSGDISGDAVSEDDAKKVLTSIAKQSGADRNGCPRHLIMCQTDSEVDEILEDLIRREVVERTEKEQSYRIRVGLFKEWLVANK